VPYRHPNLGRAINEVFSSARTLLASAAGVAR
jgi:hypothetical protein